MANGNQQVGFSSIVGGFTDALNKALDLEARRLAQARTDLASSLIGGAGDLGVGLAQARRASITPDVQEMLERFLTAELAGEEQVPETSVAPAAVDTGSLPLLDVGQLTEDQRFRLGDALIMQGFEIPEIDRLLPGLLDVTFRSE